MPSRRLNDRIRELCVKAVSAPTSEVDSVLEELKAALAEHTQRLRKMAAKKLVSDGGWRKKDDRSEKENSFKTYREHERQQFHPSPLAAEALPRCSVADPVRCRSAAGSQD